MSSLEASPLFYEREDWQLIKSEYSYAATKYQIDLIATHLDARTVEETPGGTAVKVRHLIVQPGVVVTSMSSHLVNSMTDPIRLLCFYLV
jgi:3-keto steroid reductase